MYTVTSRIEQIRQPRGGYVRPSSFETTLYDDGKTLNEHENIHWTVVGLAVDYLTRFLLGDAAKDAFAVSVKGAKVAKFFGSKDSQDSVKEIREYLKKIKGLDDQSIVNACKAVTFDVWFRNIGSAPLARTAKETQPDPGTVENVRILVERSVAFWQAHGPVLVKGFDFTPDGYSDMVSKGEGDYLTEDTLWDIKVSKQAPRSKHTLQILMYYIMGKHSNNKIFENITKIGIFNPRLNKSYVLDMTTVPDEVIAIVEKEVICY